MKPKRWVATGACDAPLHTLCYSDDGKVWLPVPDSDIVFSEMGEGVVWNGKLFVAVGSGTNTIAYSSDGLTWTGIPASTDTFSDAGMGVAWNGEMFVAVGSGTNVICYSTDGINWTGVPAGVATFETVGCGVAWNGSIWVAVGGEHYSNVICYSTDGMHWTGVAGTLTNFNYGGNAVVWGGDKFVAVGSGACEICHSTDGINWTGIPKSTDLIFGYANGVAWNGTRFVVVGAGTQHNMLYSSNGIDWIGIDSGWSTFSDAGNAVASDGNRFVAAGESLGPMGSTALSYSNDGVAWTPVAAYADGSFGSMGSGVAVGTDKIVAVGSVPFPVCYSTDGRNWTSIVSSSDTFDGMGSAVATDGTSWVVTGISPAANPTNSASMSADGVTWFSVFDQSVPGPNGETVGGEPPAPAAGFWPDFWYEVYGVGSSPSGPYIGASWNATPQGPGLGRWIVCGCGDTSIVYSDDAGVSWTPLDIVTYTDPFSDSCYGVVWNGTHFVAVGSGADYSVAYSTDGEEWTGLSCDDTLYNAGSCVAWNGDMFIVGGVDPDYAFCLSDGSDVTAWTRVAVGATTFTEQVNAIAWGDGKWVAVGSGTNSISYSSDGINWTGIASSTDNFSSGGYGVAWDGLQFIAVGQGSNSVLTSPDGVVWTPISKGVDNFGGGGSITGAGFGVCSAPSGPAIGSSWVAWKNLSNYTEIALLDHMLGTAAWEPPTAVYLALSTTRGPDDETFTELTAANGYARQEVTFDTAASGSALNDVQVVFGPCSTAAWGDIASFAIYDADEDGHMLCYGAFSYSADVQVGDRLAFEIGDVEVKLN